MYVPLVLWLSVVILVVNAKSFSGAFSNDTDLTVSTWFGGDNPNADRTDGKAADAKITAPRCFAFDNAGNMYWAEYASEGLNNAIRMINGGGVVSTWTTGVTSSKFSDNFYGIAVDSQGNIYLSDAQSLYKFDATTKAQTTLMDEVWGQTKQFHGCMRIGSDGNLYFPWAFAHKIVKVDLTTLTMSTVAGSSSAQSVDGTESAASISLPMGIDFDSNNNMYVAENHGRKIRKINLSSGQVTTIAGTGSFGTMDGGSTSTATMQGVIDVAVDSKGNVYFLDNFASTLRKVGTDGKVVTLSSSSSGSSNGKIGASSFKYPASLAFNKDGNLVISDVGNNMIRIAGGAQATSTGKKSADIAVIVGSVVGAAAVFAVVGVVVFKVRKAKLASGKHTTGHGTTTTGTVEM
jgi:hypothetical protein